MTDRRSLHPRFSCLCILLTVVCGSGQLLGDTLAAEYGVDISFPTHHDHIHRQHADNQGDGTPSPRQAFYDSFLQGCMDRYKTRSDRCVESEHDRIQMNLNQPQAVQNYTATGFSKVRAPRNVMTLLQKFWQDNVGEEHREQWTAGNTYTNHWESPSYFLSILDPSLTNGGLALEHEVSSAVQEVLEEWTGQTLVPTSLYGIRIYKEGSVLAPHVDRLPLVTSAIINVAQDVDEPWPLEVIDHHGRAHNVTMEPGDMVLYESHSVIHGRPFPLKGRFFANVFVHLEPIGHTEQQVDPEKPKDLKQMFDDALEHFMGNNKKQDSSLPDYIQPGSEEEKMWRQQYAFQLPQETRRKKRKQTDSEKTNDEGVRTTTAHQAASRGDLHALKELAKEDASALLQADRNGWRPLHEAARSGHTEVVEYLIKHGADVNERTNNGRGGNPLWWAEQQFGNDHAVVRLLRWHGAVNEPPEVEL